MRCAVLIVVSLLAATGAARPSAASGAFAGDNGRIVFSSNASFVGPQNDGEIFAIDSDGTHRTRLTDNLVVDGSPVFAPDGHTIAFETLRDGNLEVYVMDADGSNAVNLTQDAASDFGPHFSPDGQRIAFVSNRDGNFEIYVMDADGSNQTRLTTFAGDDTAPAFSPDGQQIAFARTVDDGGGANDDVFVMDADGGSPTNLTSSSGSDSAPDFSPDGQKIVFTSGRDGFDQIYLMDASGANPSRMTSTSVDGSPSFSPAGDKLVFSRDVQGQYELFVAGADGTDPVNITNSSVQEVAANWGPRETDPPETTIDAGPAGLTSDPTPQFAFSSDEPESTFECRVDQADFAPCSSPHTTPALSDGGHGFDVRATDRAGNVDTEAASRSFSVDATPPGAPALLDTDPDSPANGNAPTVTGVAESGAVVRLYTTADCTGPPAATGAAADFASPGLGIAVADDTATTVRATATDAAENTSPCSNGSITYVEVSSPPVPALAISESPVLTGQRVVFSAAGSTGLEIVRHEWDLDGDGSFETDTGGGTTAGRSYTDPAVIEPAVRVMNRLGQSAVARGRLEVRPRPPAGEPGISINGGAQFTNDPSVTIHVVWPAFSTGMLISNDGGFGAVSWVPVAASQAWRLRSSGAERLPKTVYVRFAGGPASRETYQDDIILDETRPRILDATATERGSGPALGAARARSSRARSTRRTYLLRIRARDRASGLSRVQVTSNRRRPGTSRAFRRRLLYRSASRRIYVRVRDRAGNFSRWTRARRR